MIGAAIGSVVVGALNYSSAKDADRASSAASAQQYQLATDQWNYQQGQMDLYQSHMAGAVDFASGMSYGGAGYSSVGYTAEQWDAQAALAGEGSLVAGNNQSGIDVAQGMIDDWELTFGGLEDNLSEYYNNLDPDKFAIQSKTILQDNLQKSMTQFNETMAANGLQSAGMKQQAAKEAAFLQATGNAQIDINAPETVAQMQQGFLNYGSPYKMQAESLLAGATNLDSQLKMNSEMANQADQTQRDIFDARTLNDQSMFNINATNSQLAFDAQAQNQAAAFSASASNQAAAARSAAMMGAYGMEGSSYLAGSQMTDPRIAIMGDTAANYGASSAGYMGAAGSAFGSAMNLGISAYNPTGAVAPNYSNDNGWLY